VFMAGNDGDIFNHFSHKVEVIIDHEVFSPVFR